ncbi:Aste57867_2821 [Aphanomyces stellatus]|uniref:Aste57867_2821 protein n=1 Tax=Aphanomyces stellatus TaxID=120398 RepID=A0A485KE22_9STRA|nr:hypothetical protein As57867_002814 [Aphanomyces stellatus]VFT80009.1 Aste57867_2821 [Aphanomyces stellatus]
MTSVTSSPAIPTEWKFPPPMTLAWKSPDFMPLMTRRPVFTFGVSKSKKRVRFDTVTTYVFPLTYGGSAIPRDQGPPIGLTQTHTREECQQIAEMPMTRRGRVRKFDHVDRMLLLQEAGGFSQKEVACMCFDAIAIRRSREETLAEDDDDVMDLQDLRMAKRPKTEFKIGRQ